MKYLHKPDEYLMVRSMGRTFRVTAIFDNDDEANKYMEQHTDQAVIACFGPLVIIAQVYAGVEADILDWRQK